MIVCGLYQRALKLRVTDNRNVVLLSGAVFTAPFLFFPCTWFYFVRTYIRTGNKGEKVLPYDENFRKWQKSRERERERERERVKRLAA